VVDRAPRIEVLGEFKKLNISEVFIPEFKAGLEMPGKSLAHSHIPKALIKHYTKSLRVSKLPSFFSKMRKKITDQIHTAEHHFEMQWMFINPEANWLGFRIP
tara:strand:- start:66 stop:371 length:306 start_codon:yes stop_codon:yes gene_type:complete